MEIDRLLDDHGARLYRYARTRLDNEEDIQDAIQETYLAVLKSPERFRGDSQSSTYLIGILRNKIHDIYRKKTAREYSGPALPKEKEDPVLGARVSSRDEPERQFELSEVRSIIRLCIDLLARRAKAVFVMREMDGISTKEICGLMGLSESNLNVILHRTRMELKKCLTQKGGRI